MQVANECRNHALEVFFGVDIEAELFLKKLKEEDYIKAQNHMGLFLHWDSKSLHYMLSPSTPLKSFIDLLGNLF